MKLAPDWLVARPIAHRGLHDRDSGIVENSLSAAQAAVAQGFAIECDVQLTADGEAVVFHDYTLARLTSAEGRVDALSAQAVTELALAGGGDRVATFEHFCGAVGGRVPIVCEIKSRFDGDLRLADRVATVAAAYAGPLCIESFDPRVVAHLRRHRARLGLDAVPLGMVAQATYGAGTDEWSSQSIDERRALAQFLHYAETLPDFLSYCVGDLPHAVPYLCRTGLGLPVTIWTVRTVEQRDRARRWGDQIVFEGAPDFALS